MKGHHICKTVWTPVIGLHRKLEENNEHDEALLQWFWMATQKTTYPIQYLLCCGSFIGYLHGLKFFRQCKTSAYKPPSHLCGHVECLPRPPYSYLACIWDPVFINVKLCWHPVCIGGPACIRGRRLIEEIRYACRTLMKYLQLLKRTQWCRYILHAGP